MQERSGTSRFVRLEKGLIFVHRPAAFNALSILTTRHPEAEPVFIAPVLPCSLREAEGSAPAHSSVQKLSGNPTKRGHSRAQPQPSLALAGRLAIARRSTGGKSFSLRTFLERACGSVCDQRRVKGRCVSDRRLYLNRDHPEATGVLHRSVFSKLPANAVPLRTFLERGRGSVCD
jgi:hypothetical protein